MSEMNTCEWVEEVYKNSWGNRFTWIVEKRYGHMLDAVDLMEESRQQLALYLDKCCKDPAKAERNLSGAYIVATFKSRMKDVMRSRNGKPAPRAWLQAHGEIGELLFDLICLQHLSMGQILNKSEEGYYADPLIEETPSELLLYIINEIARQKECDRWDRGGGPQYNGDGAGTPPVDLPAPPGESDSDDSRVEIIERIINLLLYGDFGKHGGDIRVFAERVAECRERLGSKVELSDDQKYILLATYRYGSGDEHMAEFLGIEVRAVRYQREKALKSLKLIVEKCGIEFSE